MPLRGIVDNPPITGGQAVPDCRPQIGIPLARVKAPDEQICPATYRENQLIRRRWRVDRRKTPADLPLAVDRIPYTIRSMIELHDLVESIGCAPGSAPELA